MPPSSTSSAVRAAAGPAKIALPDNRFFIGDCLPVLAELTARHGAFADLVYLDPPFNSARLYNHAFKGAKRALPEKITFADTWQWTPATKKDFREFTEKEAASDTGAANFLRTMRALLEKSDPSTLAYLTYMTRRLARIRAAMKPTASIYLHCDPTASHYLKLAMDAVFGRGNFRNEVVWWYKGNAEPKNFFPRKHDVLLYYAGPGATFNRVSIPYAAGTLRRYNHTDEQGRRYKVSALRRGKREIVYMKEGKAADDVWEMPVVRSAERLGYQTQKPLALLRRIIAASSNPGDVVLDPFCGCGTTIEAAYDSERRFIGVDVARSAAQIIALRMAEKAGFGKLVVGDKTPSTLRGWGRILPDDDERIDAPAWARFQYDAIAAIPKAEQIEGAIQRTARLGGDGGIDGLIHLERPSGARESVVIQVKRKKHPTPADVADTLLAVENNGAFMGLLITLNPPTAGMRERGGTEWKRFNGKLYPRVAILTYEEVKAGKFAEAIPYEYAVDPRGGKQTALNLA